MPCHPSTPDNGRQAAALIVWTGIVAVPWWVHVAAIRQVIPASAFWLAAPLAIAGWVLWRSVVPARRMADGESLLGLASFILLLSTGLIVFQASVALLTFAAHGVGAPQFWIWALWIVVGSLAAATVWRKRARSALAFGTRHHPG